MTTELTAKNSQIVEFNSEQVETIRQTIAPTATRAELQLFIAQCQRTGLDPFSRQIYFIKRGDKATVQSSVDGFRVIAERSQKYQGQTIPLFLKADGTWTEVWTDAKPPIAAKVGVYRTDFKEPLYAIARWDSYVQMYNGKPSNMWAKMPDTMLAKVAECLALRKAFPNDLSGIYSTEEMSQAEVVKPEPVKVEATPVAPKKDIMQVMRNRVLELNTKEEIENARAKVSARTDITEEEMKEVLSLLDAQMNSLVEEVIEG